MRTFITKTEDKYFLNIEGQEPIECVVKQPKGWDPTLFLPENPTGRKLFNLNKLEAALQKSDEVELAVKTPISHTGTSTRSKTPIEDYLEGEEREMFINLRDKALKNREKALNDPMAKLKAKLAKIQAEYDALIAKEAENE